MEPYLDPAAPAYQRIRQFVAEQAARRVQTEAAARQRTWATEREPWTPLHYYRPPPAQTAQSALHPRPDSDVLLSSPARDNNDAARSIHGEASPEAQQPSTDAPTRFEQHDPDFLPDPSTFSQVDECDSPWALSPASSESGWTQVSDANGLSDWDDVGTAQPEAQELWTSGYGSSCIDDASDHDPDGEEEVQEVVLEQQGNRDKQAEEEEKGNVEHREYAPSSTAEELPQSEEKGQPIEVVDFTPRDDEDYSKPEVLKEVREIKNIVTKLNRYHKLVEEAKRERAKNRVFRPDTDMQLIGTFDPDGKGYGSSPILFLVHRTSYRCVEYFIDAIEAALCVVSAETLRLCLPEFFAGAAATWYSDELSSRQRYNATVGDGMRNWYSLLRARWGVPDDRAAYAFSDFSVGLIRPGEEALYVDYKARWVVMDAVHLCRRVGIDKTYLQMIWAWSRLHPLLQEQVAPPEEDESREDFVTKMSIIDFKVLRDAA